MPGRHLSNEEDRNLRYWENPPNNTPRPMLRSVEVAGGNGLRGLNGVIVPFNYPITVVCGKNGSGKSTVLALAALAHHAPANWHVYWTNTRYRGARAADDRSYYMFPDFFHYAPNEQIPNGVSIKWRYYNNGAESELTFTKSANQWGRYSQRPEREVDYAPLSRVLPPNEMTAVRGAFSSANPQATRISLNNNYRGYLSYIMGAAYQKAEILSTSKLSFAECETHVAFSGFNMGGGENCIAHLLNRLHSLPAGGLLVVEEIESCLHPEAQVRLAEVLINICNTKRIQIVCSSHSEVFIDALPRQARILLRKNDPNNPVVEQPSTRFAVYEMSGEVQPELTVYCEDRSAAVLIEEAIPYAMRLRVRILDVGSDTTVIRQGVSHRRGAFPGDCLCVPDGDTTQAQVDAWLQSETNGNKNYEPQVELLPGNALPPERWVLDQLTLEDYRNTFAEQLGCDRAQATDHVNAMQVELNHHDIAYTLSRRTAIGREDCLRKIMKSVATHPGLEALKRRIDDLLN